MHGQTWLGENLFSLSCQVVTPVTPRLFATFTKSEKNTYIQAACRIRVYLFTAVCFREGSVLLN